MINFDEKRRHNRHASGRRKLNPLSGASSAFYRDSLQTGHNFKSCLRVPDHSHLQGHGAALALFVQAQTRPYHTPTQCLMFTRLIISHIRCSRSVVVIRLNQRSVSKVMLTVMKTATIDQEPRDKPSASGFNVVINETIDSHVPYLHDEIFIIQ